MPRNDKKAAAQDESGHENGNVLLIILLAIVLLGVLTAVIQSASQTGANIDKETVLLRASQVKSYAAELERGIAYIMENGHSEVDIRFAHPDTHSDYGDLSADADPSDQLFDRRGGGVTYQPPLKGVNDGSPWEFYGQSALPEVGSDAADLIAVLPNVTASFCQKINEGLGFDPTIQPEDSGACVNGGASDRFDDATQFSGTPNTVVEATFSKKPALQACVECTADNSYHYYTVILSR